MHARNNNSAVEIEHLDPSLTGHAVQDEMVSSTTSSSMPQTASFGTRISFSVGRIESSRVVVNKNGLAKGKSEDDEDAEDDIDEQAVAKKRGILSLEDGVVIDAEAPKAKREKKLLVIPVLRLSTQSQIERLEKMVAEGIATDADRARLALLRESFNDVIEGERKDSKNEKIALSDGVDLQSGPTAVVADDADPDYQSMPVGEFGLAFLRGCGWKDAQSCIGKSNPQAVPLRISTPRPKGLGLGAALPSTAPPPAESSARSSEQRRRDGDNEEDEKRQLAKNAYVKCLGGLNKGAIGQVTSMDEENASVFVELAWPISSAGKTVRINQLAVEVISRREFRDRIKQSAPQEAMRNGQRRIRV